MQSTSNILMIRPVAFGLNLQTADSNAFQDKTASQKDVQEKALKEFDDLVDKLSENGINVTVIEDTLDPHTPDSIFPNNWISFHEDGSIYVYPMQAKNRRLERRDDLLDIINKEFKITEINDLSFTEEYGEYLEGTGSMVLDRVNKLAYACLSIRTQEKVLNIFCKESGYEPVIFHAFDQNNQAIYHTNVMMCVAENFVVICLDSIQDSKEKKAIIQSFNKSGKKIIDITLAQMNAYAGNMLQVKNNNGKDFLIMSESAYKALKSTQLESITKYCEIIYSSLKTIEANGGGSARCMMAEIHLPKNNLISHRNNKK